jgi:transcriptional regulator with XRE-family HTH domain
MGQTFGQKIRDYRINNTSLSLRKLAEKVGISPTYLSRIETGKEPPPSEDIIIRFAQALDIDEDELLSHADKISPDLLKTIREHPGLFPSFIRTVRDVDQTRLEDILGLVQFIQSRSLRMKQTEWKHVEKIIKSLLSGNLGRDEYEVISSLIQRAEKPLHK